MNLREPSQLNRMKSTRVNLAARANSRKRALTQIKEVSLIRKASWPSHPLVSNDSLPVLGNICSCQPHCSHIVMIRNGYDAPNGSVKSTPNSQNLPSNSSVEKACPLIGLCLTNLRGRNAKPLSRFSSTNLLTRSPTMIILRLFALKSPILRLPCNDTFTGLFRNLSPV